jgi:phage terminase small subunit
MRNRKPPANLSRKAKKWYAEILRQFEFESESEFSLLEQAATCLDTIEQAEAEIRVHGLLSTTGAGGMKANPAIGIVRDFKTLFARLCRELRLNEPATETRLPRNY